MEIAVIIEIIATVIKYIVLVFKTLIYKALMVFTIGALCFLAYIDGNKIDHARKERRFFAIFIENTVIKVLTGIVFLCITIFFGKSQHPLNKKKLFWYNYGI